MPQNLYTYKVKSVMRIIDGDTIDCLLDLGFNITITQRIRLAGIDTPETKTVDEHEKKLGQDAEQWLETQLKDQKNIIIKTELENPIDKYGRILGHIYVNESYINQIMIDKGYAWSYDGGKKIKDFSILEQKKNNDLAV